MGLEEAAKGCFGVFCLIVTVLGGIGGYWLHFYVRTRYAMGDPRKGPSGSVTLCAFAALLLSPILFGLALIAGVGALGWYGGPTVLSLARRFKATCWKPEPTLLEAEQRQERDAEIEAERRRLKDAGLPDDIINIELRSRFGTT